ncbi:MAG: hypothetical protein LAT78_06690 [Roseinatronobacter sp.]|nr:hypothetical protein [Roseinatronobacter sp.]
MASFSTNLGTITTPDLHKVSETFFAVLERIATYSSTYREILYYNELSDAELAARGMTRADVAQRIFGARMGL